MYQIAEWLFSVFCSVNISTYGVFGVNSVFIQATLVSKASAYAEAEAITAEINCSAGNVKFDFKPFPTISKIASASYVIYLIM